MVYAKLLSRLHDERYTWLVTGAAGFIGSHLLETLLKANQTVVALDNFATGHHSNLDEVRDAVSPDQWNRLRLIEGDIRDLSACREGCANIEYVLHQAALGSVSRSLEDPLATNAANVDGFVNMLTAARDAKVKRFVYAGSSSTYGDHPDLPKVEDRIGRPLSPYAVTKYVNELYADVFARAYSMHVVGLRYFNVFGARQDPNGAYAAVIPKWISAMIRGEPIYVNGDGETSRDFCYVANAVQANLLAATAENPEAVNQIYNVAVGERTTLNQLFGYLLNALEPRFPSLRGIRPLYRDFRAGDVRHSQADISKAARWLNYTPSHSIVQGLQEAMGWYIRTLSD
jgi:UDP-N-acetylglucosamine 4-epimerase